MIVSGLVQTEACARELATAMGLDHSKATEFLEVRMGRRAIIDRPEPPDITLVLWEPVLHHQIGSPTVMRDQLSPLVEMPRRLPPRGQAFRLKEQLRQLEAAVGAPLIDCPAGALRN